MTETEKRQDNRDKELMLTLLKAARDYHAPNLQGFHRKDILDALARLEDKP